QDLRAEAIEFLGMWPEPPARDRIVGVYRPVTTQHDSSAAAAALESVLPQLLAGDTPDEVQAAVFAAIAALDLRAASDTLFAAVGDPSKNSASRIAALETLASFEDPRLPEAAATAGASDSPSLRLAALPIASKLSPEAALPVIENLLEQGSIEERRTAFESLAELQHPGADQLLAEQLRALSAGEVPPAAQIELLQAAAKRESPEIKKLLAKREAALAANPDPLAAFEAALAGGVRRAGERLFNQHPVMACQRCHLVDGQGGEAGPDLSNIGAVRTREQLLESVIKPNAAISPGFDNMVVTQKSGDVVVGIVASETPATLTLRQVDGKTTEVPVSTIQSRGTLPSSMPEIFGAVMTKEELRDVIAFLASLKSSPAEAAAAGPAQPRALRTTPLIRDRESEHGES
ncbi:MAG: c-type cytochrome, partial [Opitutaceae bacterium]